MQVSNRKLAEKMDCFDQRHNSSEWADFLPLLTFEYMYSLKNCSKCKETENDYDMRTHFKSRNSCIHSCATHYLQFLLKVKNKTVETRSKKKRAAHPRHASFKYILDLSYKARPRTKCQDRHNIVEHYAEFYTSVLNAYLLDKSILDSHLDYDLFVNLFGSAVNSRLFSPVSETITSEIRLIKPMVSKTEIQYLKMNRLPFAMAATSPASNVSYCNKASASCLCSFACSFKIVFARSYDSCGNKKKTHPR